MAEPVVSNNRLLVIIIILAIVSLVFGAMIFTVKEQSMGIYNLGRAIVFSWLSLYLIFKPYKVDFIGKLKISSTGNDSGSNIRIAKIVAFILATVNASISIALYFD